jgi:hypothetical protein
MGTSEESAYKGSSEGTVKCIGAARKVSGGRYAESSPNRIDLEAAYSSKEHLLSSILVFDVEE